MYGYQKVPENPQATDVSWNNVYLPSISIETTVSWGGMSPCSQREVFPSPLAVLFQILRIRIVPHLTCGKFGARY